MIRILAAAGLRWEDASPLSKGLLDGPRGPGLVALCEGFLKSQTEAPLLALKDPRSSRTLPFWLRACEHLAIDASALICIREPSAVAASLTRRNNMPPARTSLVHARYILDSERNTRELPRAMVRFGVFLESPADTIASLSSDLGFEWPNTAPRTREAVAQFVDGTLNHAPATRDTPAAWNSLGLQALLDTWSEASSRQWDEARLQLDELMKVIDPVLAQEAFLRESLRKELRAVSQSEELEQTQREKTQEQLETTSASLQKSDALLKQAQEELRTLAGKADKEREQREKTQEQLETTSASLQKSDALLKQAQEELRTLAGKADKEREQREKTQEQLETTSASLQKSDALLKQAQEELRTLAGKADKERDGGWVDFARQKRNLARTMASWVLHYGPRGAARRFGQFLLLRSSPAFDEDYYLRQYRDVARRRINPVLHYVQWGAEEGRDPSPNFETKYYLRQNPDVARSDENPLAHFIRAGQAEGRQPKPSKAQPKPSKAKRESVATRPYDNLDSYLVAALTSSDLIKTPLTEPDRRVLGVMDWLRRDLARKYSNSAGPLVSVIMPTFQRAEVITSAIRSVVAQTYENWELVIVDDGGLDDTEAIVQRISDPRITYIRLRENVGQAQARNSGIENSTGEVIAYLDSDDTWDPGFLTVSVGALQADPEIDMVYSAQALWRGTAGNPYDPADEEQLQAVRFRSYSRSLLENNNFISMIALVHYRRLFDAFGTFDPKMRRLPDWELVLRLSQNNRVAAIPVILSHYQRGHVQNHASKTEDLARALDGVQATLRVSSLNDELKHHSVLSEVPLFARMGEYKEIASPTVSIIIPSFEAVEYLAVCVESVLKWTSNYELVVVDNASGALVRAYLQELAQNGTARVIFNEENFGFTHAVNQGLEVSNPSSDVVLLNNDAMVTPGWLDALRELPQLDPEVGIAVPRQVLPGGTRTMKTHVPGCDPSREVDTTLSAHHRNVLNPFYRRSRGWVELSFAAFFCVYITRSTLDSAGALDAENGPHYRSDRLYCDVARSFANKRIVYTPDSKVYHFHQKATDHLRMSDPSKFDVMYVQNDWRKLLRLGPAIRHPEPPVRQ